MRSEFARKAVSKRIGGEGFDVGGGYKFLKIKEAKDAVLREEPGARLIDLGVGEPDDMADERIVEALYKGAKERGNRVYADNGGAVFKGAVCEFMEREYGVELDEDREVMHSIGSKSALAKMAWALVDPDDVVLTTVPGYGVFATHAQYCGGEVYEVELREENRFLPDLGKIPEEVARRAKVFILNYPNNPTGAVATREFYEELVGWAKKYGVILINDAAYGTLAYGRERLSLLSVAGAKEVAVELHSMSKSYNMTGWRLGWVCGNEVLVQAYGKVKANTDSGQFLGIQYAGAVGLGEAEIAGGIRDKYERRMQAMVEVLKDVGIECEMPGGTFFLYVKVPECARSRDNEVEFRSGEEFSQWLIRELKICSVPWDEVGAYVRFSMTYEVEGFAGEEQVMEEVRRRLGAYAFESSLAKAIL